MKIFHQNAEGFGVFLQDVRLEHPRIVLGNQPLQLQLHHQVEGVLLLESERVGSTDLLDHVVVFANDDGDFVLAVWVVFLRSTFDVPVPSFFLFTFYGFRP